jgi:hypothetical protein
MSEPEATSLGLSEAIRDLRREIGVAMAAAKDEPLQFMLGAVELELQVALTLKGGVKGEGKWLVVSIGAEAGAERARTHKVKLTLTPEFEGRKDVPVRDETKRPG